MRALLALPTPPTAVFCANDLIALGAYKACAQAGVSIPRDMSIVGCDDIEFAQLVTPELTTIAVPARELGARAARLLVRDLAGDACAAVAARAGASGEARDARIDGDTAPAIGSATRWPVAIVTAGTRPPAMAVRHAVITGTGSYVPEHVLTNADLAARLGVEIEPFVSETLGIRERHVCGDDESTADLAEQAARRALDDAGRRARVDRSSDRRDRHARVHLTRDVVGRSTGGSARRRRARSTSTPAAPAT